MSLKASVFIAVSLDGLIAREDGGLDWLDDANEAVPAGEDCGYSKFIELIDVLVMGRHTFEKVLTLGPWPYGELPVIVLSSQSIEFPADLAETVTCSKEAPAELCQRLALEGIEHIYVDGGVTIQRFLAAGLIDEITLTVIPVVLGSGIPLFADLKHDIPLEHIATKTYACGFVQLAYRVLK